MRLNDEYGNDPDQYLRNGDAAELRATIETRVGAITWRALTLLPAGRQRGRRAGEWLGSLPARWAIEQDAAIGSVAAAIDADAEAARRAFRARYWIGSDRTPDSARPIGRQR